MQISKFELYGSLLFVDKKAFKKENNAKTMSECLALIIAKACFRGITINNRKSEYKQKYSNAEECPEKNLFSTTMVPLGAYLNFFNILVLIFNYLIIIYFFFNIIK